MIDLEDCLRRELKQLSERAQPQSIRPLRVPAVRGRSRAVRWLAPVAAVAAVVGVIAVVSAVGHSVGRQPSSGGGPGRMPAYYVTADEATAVVRVRDSVTGRELASARLPKRYAEDLAISGAADDRTFLITDGSALLLLRVADDGRSARLNRLPITVADHGTDQTNVALSPDGSTVAMSSQDSCVHPAIRSGPVCYYRYSAIRLVSLTTGATRTWSTRALAQPGMFVSWDGNAHLLFSWASAPSPVPCTVGAPCPLATGYRLLDVTARGGDLLSARLLPLPALVKSAAFVPESAFITPDGRAVIAATISVSVAAPGQGSTAIMKIVELSARTGRLLRVLREVREHIPALAMAGTYGCYVFSLGPTGIHALIRCSAPPNDVFGRLDNGRFTPLPGLGGFIPGGAAW